MNMDMYNHGTLGVASDKHAVSLGNFSGAFEGWDLLLTTETKYGLFLVLTPSPLSEHTPVQQKDNTVKGKFKHCAVDIQHWLL